VESTLTLLNPALRLAEKTMSNLIVDICMLNGSRIEQVLDDGATD